MIRFRLPLLALFITTLPVSAADLTTLAGKKVSGQIVKLDKGILTIQTDSGPVPVPTKEILTVDFASGSSTPPAITANTKYDEVTLTDGSTFRIASFKIKKKQFAVTMLPGPANVASPEPTIELSQVFHVLRGAEQSTVREAWAKLVAGRGKRDMFVTRSSEGVLSPLPGTLIEGSDDGDSVKYEREDGQSVTLQLRRATGGIVFNQPPIGVVPPTLCKVVDAFGNVLFAQSIEVNQDQFAVKTIHGALVKYPSHKALAKLDFSQGNIVYLSELDPAVSAPKPIPGEPYYTFLRDKSQDNNAIRLGGVTYSRGVWIAPETSLSYKLPSDFREFKAVVGIDDGIEIPTSQVKLTIEGDGRMLFSGLVVRKDKPKELVIDVKGVRELRVTVAPDAQFAGNQVTLADARFQK
ncbi:MAG: NPCBM/NEW2 domain-containing protein [Gemmataceae bacterium]